MAKSSTLSTFDLENEINEAVKQLQNTGIGVIGNFFTEEELVETRAAIKELLDANEKKQTEDVESNKPGHVFKSGNSQFINEYFLNSVNQISYFYETKLGADGKPSVNKIGHGLHVKHDLFARLSFSSKIKSIAKAVNMKRPVIPQSMVILKDAGTGGFVVPHKDSTYLYTEPTTNLLGIWVPLLDCDQNNGCLWYVENSHRQLKRRLYVRTAVAKSDQSSDETSNTQSMGTYIDGHLEQEYLPEMFKPLELPAGSCVLIDGFVVHKSHENHSDRCRPAFTLHLVDMPDGVSWPSGNWLQPTEDYQFPVLFDHQD